MPNYKINLDRIQEFIQAGEDLWTVAREASHSLDFPNWLDRDIKKFRRELNHFKGQGAPFLGDNEEGERLAKLQLDL